MLMVHESYVNRTEGYRFGDSDWYEAHTDNRARLFRYLQREFGRCESKMYVDLVGGGYREIGYVFLKKMQYDRTIGNSEKDFYLREVWVQVREVEEKDEDSQT